MKEKYNVDRVRLDYLNKRFYREEDEWLDEFYREKEEEDRLGDDYEIYNIEDFEEDDDGDDDGYEIKIVVEPLIDVPENDEPLENLPMFDVSGDDVRPA